jgi:hypothetical protein
LTELIKVTLRLGRRACPRCLANIQTLLALATLIVTTTGASFSAPPAMQQQTPAREIAFPTTIQWNKQRGITRYRFQIAGDGKFQNVFLDRLVTGERYVVSDLSSGYYYWRVAPADPRSGRFSRPLRFFVSGGVMTTVRPAHRAAGARSAPPKHLSVSPR